MIDAFDVHIVNTDKAKNYHRMSSELSSDFLDRFLSIYRKIVAVEFSSLNFTTIFNDATSSEQSSQSNRSTLNELASAFESLDSDYENMVLMMNNSYPILRNLSEMWKTSDSAFYKAQREMLWSISIMSSLFAESFIRLNIQLVTRLRYTPTGLPSARIMPRQQEWLIHFLQFALSVLFPVVCIYQLMYMCLA